MIQENDVDIDGFIADTQETERNEKQEGTSKGFKTPKGLGIGQKAIVRFVNGIPSTPTDPGVPGSGRAKLVNIAWIQDENLFFQHLLTTSHSTLQSFMNL